MYVIDAQNHIIKINIIEKREKATKNPPRRLRLQRHTHILLYYLLSVFEHSVFTFYPWIWKNSHKHTHTWPCVASAVVHRFGSENTAIKCEKIRFVKWKISFKASV